MAIVYGTNIEVNKVPSLDLRFADRKSLVDTISGRNLIDFSRSSTGTYVGSDGLIKTAAVDEARFDHDPVTGESLGLLVEEARTNLSLRSQQLGFAAGNWFTNAATCTDNQGLAPDGTITAARLVPNTTDTIHYVGDGTGASLSGTATVSVFAKADGYNFFGLAFDYASGDGLFSGSATFDLSTGQISLGASTTGSIQQLPNGWYRCTITATVGSTVQANPYIFASPALTYSSFAGDGTSGILLWGFQFESGSFPTSYIPTTPTFTSRASDATYYDANGTIQTAATNVARDDAYFPDENGVMRPAGLLLEAAGTNYIDESVNLTDTGTWNNYKFLTPTLNAGTAPDGTTTATSLVPNTENVNRTFNCYNIATTFQGTLTVSVFAKANGYNKFRLSIDQASAGGAFGGGATFDLSTGTVTQGASGVGTITKLPNGWYRCAVTHTNTAQAFTVTPGIQGLDNSDNTVWAGDGTSGYLFWGFQLEESPYPTSYIPTTTSTVTRAADVSSSSTVTRSADVASITGSNFSSWYNQSEGTFYAKLHDGKKSGRILEANDNTDNNRHGLVWTATNSQFFTTTAGSTFFNSSVTTSTNPRNSVLAYKSGLYAGTAAGLTPTTNSGTTVPNITQIWIGGPVGNGSALNNYTNGTISRLTYYPQRLQDTTLQKLTS